MAPRLVLLRNDDTPAESPTGRPEASRQPSQRIADSVPEAEERSELDRLWWWAGI
jgi:hypothetical protein